ncbi:energy-coupling factor transporter transmembrane component T [Senegalia massiliensis]|uniref:Energy-coupling factor transporter transmembrane protein EcfT n=1 Tax=Senegalia massiliensis TaxID=1720316 RepID=A0A845QZG9_9CLOT|nr:energy-coupling factor transporter transmembrane component T [Senegalia massiliensis]NBI06572.1 energy-coupling factor transporter transmembrane protein EcfT [Senegalia massiliensis]
MRALDSYHPIVIFTYFCSVILFSMFFMHPIFLAISLLSSIIYLGVLKGFHKTKKTILLSIPIFLLIAISNPIFSHKGVTPLFYVNYNPITLESIIYGLSMASMIITVIYWFSCYNEIMTSDKFISLFGQVSPNIALIISMTLNTIPRMKSQIKLISNSQKTLGMYVTSGSIMKRAKSSIRILSILITWALENAIDTADSMKSRGYGLKGRSSYSIFKFRKNDLILLSYIIFLVIISLYGEFFDYISFSYYPYITDINSSSFAILLYFSYLLLMTLPVAIEFKEEIKWRSSISKI